LIEPDKSSKYDGELKVIVGFEPKLEPKSNELPSVYKDFDGKEEELKSVKLLELMELKVSLPLEVRIIVDERLCNPGSLKKLILLELSQL
jgi:hypothetical protein